MPSRHKYLASKVKHSDEPELATQEARDQADTGEPHMTEFEVDDILKGKRPAPKGTSLADKGFVEYLKAKEDPTSAAADALRANGVKVTSKREVAKQLLEGNRDPSETPGLKERLSAPFDKDKPEEGDVLTYLRKTRRFPGSKAGTQALAEDSVIDEVNAAREQGGRSEKGGGGVGSGFTGLLGLLPSVAVNAAPEDAGTRPVLNAWLKGKHNPNMPEEESVLGMRGVEWGGLPRVDKAGRPLSEVDKPLRMQTEGLPQLGADGQPLPAPDPTTDPTTDPLQSLLNAEAPSSELRTPLPDAPPVWADPLDPPYYEADQTQQPQEQSQQSLLDVLQVGPGPQAPGIASADPELVRQQAAAAKEAAAASDEAAAAVRDSAAAAQAATLEASQNYMGALADAHEQASIAANAKLNSLKEAQRAEGAFNSTMAELKRASAVELDPGRYWARQGDGQKALAVLAGALFGFTGKGMDWLGHLKSLVDQDMRAQESDRDSKVRGLEQVGAGYLKAREFAIQAGATEAEAALIQKAGYMEMAQGWLQRAGMLSSNAQVQANAAKAAAALEQEKLNISTQLLNSANARAETQNAAAFRRYQMQLQEREMRLNFNLKAQMQMQQGGASGTPIQATVRNAMNEKLEEIVMLQQLADIVDVPTIAGRAGRSVQRLLDTDGTSEGYIADRNARELAVSLGKKKLGALQSHDFPIVSKTILDIQSGAPLLSNPGPALKQSTRNALHAMRQSLDTMANQYDVRDYYKKLDQIEAGLGGKTAPSYAKAAQ